MNDIPHPTICSLQHTSDVLDSMEKLHGMRRGAARKVKDKEPENKNKLGRDHIWTEEQRKMTAKGKLVRNFKHIKHSVNRKVQAKLSNQDMMVWLGQGEREKLPLDKDVRAKKRRERFSLFSDFVDESLKLLDDYEERELMLKGVENMKRKVRDIIYNDEKLFADCIFRDQLRHEKLHSMPLCSQRKFQESCDNYKRGEKELKILMATIRRIDKFDCTFMSCKLTNSHIDDNWCSQISSALNGNDFLQQLYLSGNYITDEGVSR